MKQELSYSSSKWQSNGSKRIPRANTRMRNTFIFIVRNLVKKNKEGLTQTYVNQFL